MAFRAMKWLGISLLLVISALSPVVTAAETYSETDYVSEYSLAVQVAFDRCAALPPQDGTWLVVSASPLGIKTPLLPHAWLVDAQAKDVQHWLDIDRIEAACPQIEYQHEPRWTPNDPRFGDQCYLEYRGQTTGGVVG